MLRILSKTKILILTIALRIITKMIPPIILAYLKVWVPFLLLLLGYFRTFCFVVGNQ